MDHDLHKGILSVVLVGINIRGHNIVVQVVRIVGLAEFLASLSRGSLHEVVAVSVVASHELVLLIDILL